MTSSLRFPSTKISALVSDVDGTLVTDDKILTPRAQAAVAELRASGITFTIISSRPPRGLRILLEPLGITTPVSGFNGGVITTPDLSVITEHLLSPDAARRAVDMLCARQVQVWVFSGQDWWVRDPEGPYVGLEEHTVGFPTSKIATIGDMPNDVLMFRNSGLSIAMGNASQDVQSRADLVTASYEDEGFAKAIERFVLHCAPSSLSEAR
jgi:hydroxymethylpyrimidine pyrophosphatase-like HAD family hydrolase